MQCLSARPPHAALTVHFGKDPIPQSDCNFGDACSRGVNRSCEEHRLKSSTLEKQISGKADLTDQIDSKSRTNISPRRIVLTGFMGSGKSTVGPLVAQRLGWKFVDVDDVIEAEAGTSITSLFATEGEVAFRDREHAAIARLTADHEMVMALGGGAIERAETRNLLLTAPGTLLVHLEVELATTLARCRGTEHARPVLADQANLERRYRRRLPLYRTAHASITVDTLTPEQVADAIMRTGGF